jgi:hypothetical protein
MLSSVKLKRMIYAELTQSGFKCERNVIKPPNLSNKRALRRVHRPALQQLLADNKKWILENEKDFLEFFADGDDIKPEEISPKLVLIKDPETIESGLFRYASYLWSVPLSGGFGRRLRYLVMDQSNEKLIGIIGLTDPVIGLKVRDDWIGWDKTQKERALWHVMDAYAFGAVQPYNHLLGGKLVATLATSDEVREDFRRKYSHGRSVITGRNYKSRKPHLVLLTTTGAYGKSSILDRLRTARKFHHARQMPCNEDSNKPIKNRELWTQVGFTEGWGFFHLNNGITSNIYEYLKGIDDPIVHRHRFGQGPNWKMRLVRHGLESLGLDYDKFGKHGVKRGFYAAPLAKNFKRFLLGEQTRPIFYRQSAKELFEYFRVRYLLRRACTNKQWSTFDHRTLRVSKSLKASNLAP